MATIKSYSDLQQSKVLATILPIESADMYYDDIVDRVTGELFIPNDGSTIKVGKGLSGSIAAWSLAALLGVLPRETRLLKSATDDIYYHCDCPKGNVDKWFDNPVDACVTMIERLHELKML